MEKDRNTSPVNGSNGSQAQKRPSTLQRPDLLKVLNKNPKYEYRWVVFNQVRDLGGIHPSGWRLLTTLSKSEEDIIKEFGLGQVRFVDGAMRRNELALAFMTKEDYRSLKEAKEFDRLNQIRAVRKKTGHNVDREGIFHDEFEIGRPR